MTNTTLIKTNNRPEINGLRAIAVLSIVFYHLGFSSFSGGYVGVDVFFVISGYLITRMLAVEMEQNGRIDFRRFYLRRMRRLLPAFFFTLCLTTVCAILFLSPRVLDKYGSSLLHSLFSISNIYFFTESGYFDIAASLKPLLHTWSLGVEEQFYLIWPFIFFIAYYQRSLMPLFIAILGLFSLYFAHLLLYSNPTAVFYMTPFRVFEFALGGILVWFTQYKLQNARYLDLIFIFGIALIIFSIATFDNKTLFPGVNALIPCAGTALCIYAAEDSSCGVILKNKILVGIGLISYSLYLIHWPLIVFYKHITFKDELNILDSLALIAGTGLAAVFMFLIIESPYRRIKESNSSFLFIFALLSISICFISLSLSGFFGLKGQSWAIDKHYLQLESKNNTGKKYRFHIRQKMCEAKGWENCDVLVKDKINVLVVGDSHAVDALNAFYKIFPSHNFSLSELGGCPPYDAIEKITPPSHPDRLRCKDLNRKRYNSHYIKKFDYIIINVLLDWYKPEHLNQYLDFLQKNTHKRVIVLGSYLSLKKDMLELIYKFNGNTKDISRFIEYSYENEDKLKKYTEEHGFLFLSKRDVFCKKGTCELFDINGTPFTYDQHHLAYEFAERIAQDQEEKIRLFLADILV